MPTPKPSSKQALKVALQRRLDEALDPAGQDAATAAAQAAGITLSTRLIDRRSNDVNRMADDLDGLSPTEVARIQSMFKAYEFGGAQSRAEIMEKIKIGKRSRRGNRVKP